MYNFLLSQYKEYLMTYGYIRVSTEKQDYENQKHGILNYAHDKKFGHVEFVEEKVSSRKKLEERGIWTMINETLKEGDILIVSELSRLGRSTMEIMTIFKHLAEKNIMTHVIKGGFVIGDPNNKIQSSVLIFAFGLAAEIERELISQRTKEALAVKKAGGMKLGRPKGAIVKSKLDGKETAIIELLDKKIPVASIAKIFGVARTTMVNFIETRKLDNTKTKGSLFSKDVAKAMDAQSSTKV
jgi:DNA invertase Pin-like site-specific DNA recombinase